jgi:hypothetical protein
MPIGNFPNEPLTPAAKTQATVGNTQGVDKLDCLHRRIR